MDQPMLTDEERRLLREYRITKVPARINSNEKQHNHKQEQQQQPEPQSLQSCSSASSSSSSGSSTPSIGSLTAINERPKAARKINSQSSPKQQQTQQQQQQSQSQTQPKVTQEKDQHVPSQKSKSHSPQLHSHGTKAHQNHHHNHQHGHRHTHHNGHHHHHHHRRHKSITPTQELTPDELGKMLELASGISYLKLVNPDTVNSMQSTKSTSIKTASTKKNQNHKNLSKTRSINGNSPPETNDFILGNGTLNNVDDSNQRTFTNNLNINCNSNSSNNLDKIFDRIVSKPYIFEKVDYIKKISIRRKALKKLKRNKNKSCSVSPLTTTGSSTAVES